MLDSKFTHFLEQKITGITGELPKKGWVAGSFMMAAFREWHNKGFISPNDLDIFELDSSEVKPEEGHDSGYGGKEVDGYGGEYKVIETIRDGFVNYIKVRGVDDISTLVREFDINICMAGFDLKSKKVYVNDQALEEQTILVNSIAGPFYTGLRLLKKAKNTTYSCDLNKEFLLLKQGLIHAAVRENILIPNNQTKIKFSSLGAGFTHYDVEELSQYLPLTENDGYWEIQIPEGCFAFPHFSHVANRRDLQYALQQVREYPMTQAIDL